LWMMYDLTARKGCAMRYRGIVLITVVVVGFTGFAAVAQQRDIMVVARQQTGGAYYDNIYALVIGVERYKNASYNLDYAADDAMRFKKLLTELGVPQQNIKLLLDSSATAQGIRRGVDWLKARAKSNDGVIIFYAGHGKDEFGFGNRKMGYIVPYDGDMKRLISSCIGMDEVKRWGGALRAGHVLVLLSCCHSGLAGLARSIPEDYTPPEIKWLLGTPSRLLITAGGGGEQDIELPSLAGSPFAYSLVEAIRNRTADINNDGFITAGELYAAVRPKVVARANRLQHPKIFNLSGDDGEFVFYVGRAKSGHQPKGEQAKPAPPPVQPVAPAGEVEADLSEYNRLIQEAEQAKRQEEAERLRREREKAQYGARRDAAWQKVRPIVQGDYPRQVKMKAAVKFAQDFPEDNPYLEELESELGGTIKALALNPFIEIPAGTFMMGCAPNDSSYDSDEKPYHEVYLDAYYIQKHEVTVAEYRECVNAGTCTEPQSKSDSKYCNWGYSDRDNHPINCVTWHQAKAYCEWIGGRLPTEAEWEKAARGTDGRIYPWGNAKATCEYAVMDDGSSGCGKDRTWPVCSKPRGNSPYGLCDMSGNVREWVNDWYKSGYYKSSPRDNPRGPSSGGSRVVRGGGWVSDPGNLRASNRGRFTPGTGDSDFGFRCALGNP